MQAPNLKKKELMKNMPIFLFLILSSSPVVYAQDTLVLSTIQKSNITPALKAVVVRAYKELGIEVKIKQSPAARSLLQANEGTVDGELGRTRFVQAGHPNLIKISIPVFIVKMVAFSKLNIRLESGIKDLSQYRVGVVRGYKDAEALVIDRKSTLQVTDAEQLIHMVNFGRIDAGLFALTNGLILLKKLGIHDIHALEPPLAQLELYHYLHKKHSSLVPMITKVLERMERDGSIEEIWKGSK